MAGKQIVQNGEKKLRRRHPTYIRNSWYGRLLCVTDFMQFTKTESKACRPTQIWLVLLVSLEHITSMEFVFSSQVWVEKEWLIDWQGSTDSWHPHVGKREYVSSALTDNDDDYTTTTTMVTMIIDATVGGTVGASLCRSYAHAVFSPGSQNLWGNWSRPLLARCPSCRRTKALRKLSHWPLLLPQNALTSVSHLKCFLPVTPDEVNKIIMSIPAKSSPLDFIPTSLIKDYTAPFLISLPGSPTSHLLRRLSWLL